MINILDTNKKVAIQSIALIKELHSTAMFPNLSITSAWSGQRFKAPKQQISLQQRISGPMNVYLDHYAK